LIGQDSFAFATIRKTDINIEYRRALDLSEKLAVNKNKFTKPFFLLFTVPEKNEDTGEQICEPNNEVRLKVTRACHIAFKNKLIGPSQMK
jgi:hypothetical protein